MKEHARVVIYDTDCAFCTWYVLLLLKIDTCGQYKFTGLTSQFAKDFFAQNSIIDTEMIWLVESHAYYYKSTAVLCMFAKARWFLAPIHVARVIPRFIRDRIYDYVSARRKSIISGNVCPIIPVEYHDKFLP